MPDALTRAVIALSWLALGIVAATDSVVVQSRRDALTDLLTHDADADPVGRELRRRYHAYRSAATCVRILLFAVSIYMASTLGVATTTVAVVGVLAVELAGSALVRAEGRRSARFFAAVARLLRLLTFPVSAAVGAMRDRPSERPETSSTADDSALVEERDEVSAADSNADLVLEKQERAMIHRILDFPDTLVNEIMVPRTDMVCIDVATPFPEYLGIVQEARFSRLPVFEGSVDNIVGILHLKDLMHHWGADDIPLGSLMRTPVLAVPDSKRVNELFGEFRAQRLHLAIVLDEYGGTAGMVTIEDILEEIVGEIQDEFDAEEEGIREQPDGSYLLRGSLPIDDLNELLGTDLPCDEVNSVGGLLVELYGRVPPIGASIPYEALVFHVTDADARRVLQARLEVARPNGFTGSGEEPDGIDGSANSY
ncbi:HlyC/CorC family transporter [Candidatus Poribacteria bacterium]|nr:HlyC/CorC family transporter [Candidatus Poribacteria bacterium]